MDHWRLDADDAAFEDERQERDKQRRLEAARVHEESSQFYQLARAAQERTIQQPTAAATLRQQRPTLGGEKRKAPMVQRLNCVKVTKVTAKDVCEAGSAPASAPPAAAETADKQQEVPVLPGMSAYDDDSSEGEDG